MFEVRPCLRWAVEVGRVLNSNSLKPTLGASPAHLHATRPPRPPAPTAPRSGWTDSLWPGYWVCWWYAWDAGHPTGRR